VSAVAHLTQAQAIECFHLAFLQVLGARVNRNHYVVKGGANLRYFFDSHRYSEDIDFDALIEEPWKLQDKVDEVIGSSALVAQLRSKDVAIADINRSKQTDTTQRWKVLLAVPGRRDPVSTKIEFSRRNADERRLLEAVPDRVVATYGLRPPTLVHYVAAPATEQKVMALALRNETQARDVFDLELLFRGHPAAVEKGALDSKTLNDAAERCVELPFEAFESQVIPFLEADIAELYVEPSSWEQMQAFVVDKLMELDDEND
jgi:predicted nucleotidyltransferase component of viral defense system